MASYTLVILVGCAVVALLLLYLLLHTTNPKPHPHGGKPRPHGAPHGGKMTCGDGVPLCGVLVLQSGYGRGPYKHPEPSVHGLWPQTGQYGSSKCLKPDRVGSPQEIYPCYNQKGERKSELAQFQKHEWEKHGRCAGVDSASDYFKQICTLSSRPLQMMRQSRSQGGNLQAMADALTKAGYSIHELAKGTSEIHLSACAGQEGDWKLSSVEDFSQNCRSGGRHRKGLLAKKESLSSIDWPQLALLVQA